MTVDQLKNIMKVVKGTSRIIFACGKCNNLIGKRFKHNNYEDAEIFNACKCYLNRQSGILHQVWYSNDY